MSPGPVSIVPVAIQCWFASLDWNATGVNMGINVGIEGLLKTKYNVKYTGIIMHNHGHFSYDRQDLKSFQEGCSISQVMETCWALVSGSGSPK